MSRALPPASSARAPHASAPGNPARAARHAARHPASHACLKPSRRVGFASLAPRREASPRRSGTLAASEDPDVPSVEEMVDVDAIRAMIDSDPAVRAQEARIASEARNAASLQVDKQMAEASEDIRSELSRRGSAASDELAKTQEAALAELEARSDAVLRAEAKMREIAAEREALEAEAGETVSLKRKEKKWGASVGDDVDEDAERVESAKAAACSAIAGTLLSAPLLLSQSPGGLVSLESLGGVFASTALFGVVFRYATRDDLGNDQLKTGVVGAFGLTRGLGEADVYLHGSDASAFEAWAEAALLVGESMLTFAFAYAALEYGFKNEILKPFPTRAKNAPRSSDGDHH